MKLSIRVLLFGLISSLFVAIAPVSAHAIPAEQRTSLLEDSFVACGRMSAKVVPTPTALGDSVGSGISEELSGELLSTINEGLAGAGREPIPLDAHALRYMDDGRILVLNHEGHVVQDRSDFEPMQNRNAVWNEVKRIVGACLGFGGAGGMGFEQLVRWLGNPINATKFVIRRIGIVGAISCVGGIIWSYI